ncbi:unnamed protein product [Macrosiphum euphorbiae]|nr:unnamed protein product [Macrosiphum euphorbiae]
MALSENESTIKSTLPWIEYNDHFKIIKLLKDQLTYQTYEVKCKHCVTTKSRTADTRSKTNLRNHLKDKHSNIHSVKKLLSLKRSDIGFNEGLQDSADLNNSKTSKAAICNQPSLFEFTGVRKSIVSQSEFDQLILNLIVNATLPFSLVEQNDFKLLCQKGFPSRTLLSRPTLMCRLNAAFDHLICNLIKDMSSVKYLTTTADCWSIFKRSYIGITCHWIDEENLSRKSVLLTIKRLDGRHTFDVLAAAMESVYIKFEILNKISFTTTDNGSNFVKSFK